MNLSEVVEALKAHFMTAENEAKSFLEQHLPVVADLAAKAAANPALNAILNAEHLGEVPVFVETIAKLITDADAAMAQSKANGAAEATAAAQAAQAAPAEQPAAEGTPPA